MAEFWAEYGAAAYLLAAVWAFFEGETFVLAASAIGSMTGAIDPFILMGSVWIGSFLGDQTWFILGRRYGPRVMKRYPKAEAKMASATSMLLQYGTLFVLTFRFLYGIRNVAAAACGLAGMGQLRFALLNFIAAGVWAGSFVAAGWYLGALIGPERLFHFIAGGALLILAVVLFRRFYLRRRSARTVPVV
ncbi:DedA family protein [Roseomonas nepalensis]|uniref:DedA family protein n=1 Tax=Muricoccus nepalensis TaxID=1854500 RepID=A0A502GBM8_9PROT|nr:DedA family protein [Roseomonas nepalensis]TPG59131.1 DedA family protein [Roseomonas nepalensis]